MAQTIEHLPAMRETQVQSLGREDLLEKEMATHSTILAWKIPWTEKPGTLRSIRSQRVHTNLRGHFIPGKTPSLKVSIVKEERYLNVP